MSIEAALFARASAVPELTALIGSNPVRLAPVVVPEAMPLPAIAYQLVSETRDETMGVRSSLKHARVQFTILADDYATALAVDAACETAFDRWRGTAAGVVVQDTFIENSAAGLDSETGQENGEGTMTRTKDLLFHYEA